MLLKRAPGPAGFNKHARGLAELITLNVFRTILMVFFLPDPTIVGFTLTVVNEFRRFLGQFSTNFHDILRTLFSIHVVPTLNISRNVDKYLRS